MPAAGASSSSKAPPPAGGIIEARRSKEAAYYGVDAMEFTDRATQIISDYVEGALADVRAQFVEALRRRGGGASRASSEADAFYEEHVASRAAAFLARMHKQLDRGADKFELYLARNIFKVPASSQAAAAAEKEADAMDVVGSSKEQEQEQEEGGAVPLPASVSEVPAPQDEEAVDNLLTEARVRIRTLRRQRKAVEAMQVKATADLDITQKEAHALRVRVLQALSLGEGAEGGLAEMLEVVKAQGQEAAQLVLQAEGLIPQLAARQGQDGEGTETSSSQGSCVNLGGVVSIAPDMSDIRTHTKAHLKGLANALAPGTRV